MEKLEELESKQPMQPKSNKRIKRKIEDRNRKIRRVKGGGKTKQNLIAKRDALKLQVVDLTPRLIEGSSNVLHPRALVFGGTRAFLAI